MAQEINETVKEAYNNGANATTDAAAVMMQNVKVKNHALDITSLVLVAVLFAAGCILDFTVAKSLSIGNIQPEFVIASFCLSILLVRPKIYQGAIIGALAATLIQFNTSIPFLEYACDIPAAIIMNNDEFRFPHASTLAYPTIMPHCSIIEVKVVVAPRMCVGMPSRRAVCP